MPWRFYEFSILQFGECKIQNCELVDGVGLEPTSLLAPFGEYQMLYRLELPILDAVRFLLPGVTSPQTLEAMAYSGG